MFVDRKEIYNFKASYENVNFPTQFCVESIYKKFGAFESRYVSYKENAYGFSVDYNAIDKSDISKLTNI